MLKKTLIVLFVGLCTLFAQAQQTYSKMFDLYGGWESAYQVINYDSVTKSVTINGDFINPFDSLNDSLRYNHVFNSSIDFLGMATPTYLIGKRSMHYYSGFPVILIGSNKHLLIGEDDSLGSHKYWLTKVQNNGQVTSKINIENQSLNFKIKSIDIISNKLFFIGYEGESSLAPFSILCSDTSGKQIWYKKFAGKRTRASSVVLGNDGHFLLGGYVYRGDGISDSIFGWYAKMDTAGNLLWEKTMDFSSQYYLANCELSKYENRYFINGSNDPSLPVHYNKDSAFTYLLEFDNSGKILSYKRPITHPDKQRVFVGYYSYKNGFRYGIGGYYTTEGTEYIMLVKLDLQGNLIWKRLFKQWYRDNRAWSLTAVNDGFIICADGKDTTHTTGFTDAWIIKTDTNGCVVPGCHLKDGLVQLLNPELLLSVYPNPTSSQLNITITDNLAALKSAVIYDALGNQIHIPQNTNTFKQITLNTTSLQAGYYYVVIELQTGEKAVKKVLINP